MADSVECAGFWLPSEFFDDFLTDKNNNKNNVAESDSGPCFPTEFPYDFEPYTIQHLGKKGSVMSTSPQSTLAHMWSISGRSAGGSSNGSPNGVSSPTTAPLGATNDALGDLIYRAAGQVAKLKLSGGDGLGPTTHELLVGPLRPKTFNPSDLQKIHFQQHMVQQMYQNRRGTADGVLGQDAWPIQRNPARNNGSGRRAVMLGGSGVKRECAGTGVFLPRRYENNNNNNNIIKNNSECNAYYSSDTHKKTGYSGAFVPNRNGHSFNNNFGKINGFVQSQARFQPNLDSGFVPDYDLLMARKNALMLQHQHRLLEGTARMSRGVYLPQEWTY